MSALWYADFNTEGTEATELEREGVPGNGQTPRERELVNDNGRLPLCFLETLILKEFKMIRINTCENDDSEELTLDFMRRNDYGWEGAGG